MFTHGCCPGGWSLATDNGSLASQGGAKPSPLVVGGSGLTTEISIELRRSFRLYRRFKSGS